ncbi:MAG: hypothetical protein WAR39_10875 [Prevotella sp.]
MKNKINIVFLLIFVLFNACAFIIPFDRNNVFWIEYIFTIIPFCVLLYFSIKNTAITKKSVILHISVIYVGISYLISQILLFIVLNLLSKQLPLWLVIIISIVVCIFFIVCLLLTEIDKNIITNRDVIIDEKVDYIKELQLEVDMITEKETDEETISSLKKLSEKIKYSDPMSDASLVSLESKIKDRVSLLSNQTDKKKTISEISQLLDQRNRQCILLKE